MRRWVAVTDVLAVGSALLGVHTLRYGVLPEGSPALTALVIIPPATVAAFALLGLYGDGVPRPLPELGRSMLAITFVLIALIVGMFWTEVYLSRTWLALTWAVACVLVIASRATWRLGSRALH